MQRAPSDAGRSPRTLGRPATPLLMMIWNSGEEGATQIALHGDRNRTPLVYPSEIHGVLEVLRVLHLHIDLQCAAQTGHKQVGLLPFGDVVAAGELGEELVDEVVDRTRPAELGQFAEGVAADGRPEATVDGLNELRPRWNAAITLQPKVPSGGCLVEVEGCRPGLVRLRGAIGLEALLAFVQPDCRIVLAVVVGELELVRGRWVGGWRIRSRGLELVCGKLLQDPGLDPIDGYVQC